MGLLTEGTPLSWQDTKAQAEYVRKHGIIQFINLYEKLKDRRNDMLKWGDEVEYCLVKLDAVNKRAQLSLSAEKLLPLLQAEELSGNQNILTLWRPEYASYMIEGVPGQPYGHLMGHLNTVEANMRRRRAEIQSLLGPNEFALSLTAFPQLGCPNFSDPIAKPTPHQGVCQSLFLPDSVIFNGHPRFKTLTRNIRERRGKNVAINIPVFVDKNTPKGLLDDFEALGDRKNCCELMTKPGFIYMDAMGFGMGCSCLQMTFQACSINEARHLYDQLTPLCPILLMLSAAAPVHRGWLADIDTRWQVIAQSVDDRTEVERGTATTKGTINKSRYDSIDSYLSNNGANYNDIPLVLNQEAFKTLREAGIDVLLAQHIAHLFIRDPISLFSEKIHLDDNESSDHFENIQSTNWQTMRFKPPPPGSSIGWRVEFRATEVQLTDFENAAYVCFIVLITRLILTMGIDLLLPISQVDTNLSRAYKRDAIHKEKLYFRDGDHLFEKDPVKVKEGIQELTVNEIINGGPTFPGLVPLIFQYLAMTETDVDTMCTVTQYLKLIQRRASGELLTTASWIRKFVVSHPDYKHDSRVTESISYSLVEACQQITSGDLVPHDLLLPHRSKTQDQLSKVIEKAETFLDVRRNKLSHDNLNNGNGNHAGPS